MAPRASRGGGSLRQCYEETLLPPGLRPDLSRDRLRTALVSLSPIHYRDGDMRRDYGWTRAICSALLVAGALALGVRLVLTLLFVALVTTDAPVVALFNFCLSLVVGRLLLDEHAFRPNEPRRSRRDVWRASAVALARRVRSRAASA
ncbi:hypothetical protein, partial [Halorussus sp. GCM10023401]